MFRIPLIRPFINQQVKDTVREVLESGFLTEGPVTRALEQAFRDLATQKGLGLGKVAQPVRVAVTGTTVSPPLFDTLVLLGREEALARIDAALARIGG